MSGLKSGWNAGALEASQTNKSRRFYRAVEKRKKRAKRIEAKKIPLSDSDRDLLNRVALLGNAKAKDYVKRIYLHAVRSGPLDATVRDKLKSMIVK